MQANENKPRKLEQKWYSVLETEVNGCTKVLMWRTLDKFTQVIQFCSGHQSKSFHD